MCKHNGRLINHKEQIVIVLGEHMELENIMLTEISQTPEEKYHSFFLIHGV
jgi:hypothetical protein